MERIEALINHYTDRNEDLRFSTRHGSVEFLTTVHYVEKYLFDGARILEIGAGSGRYSHYFARKGYEVDAVELVPHNIDIFKANTQPGERVTVKQGDAVNLEGVPSDTYDIILLLGPMYHLYSEGDMRDAMSEAVRVTKPEGVVFAAYISNDAVALYTGFMRGLFEDGTHDHLIDFDTFKLRSTPEEVFSMVRREEIDELMDSFDVERLNFVGTDMLTEYFAERVNSMSDKLFDLYMKYHLTVCERSDMVGLSSHLLDIFRKKQEAVYERT